MAQCENSKEQSGKSEVPPIIDPPIHQSKIPSVIDVPIDQNKIPLVLNHNNEALQSNGPIQIFCRVKCLGSDNDTTNVKLLSPNSLSINVPDEDEAEPSQTRQYVFSHIYTSYSTQQVIFHDTTFQLLQNLVDGFDAVMLVYGGVDCGRKFALYGAFTDPGIIPKCIDTLFSTIKYNQAKKFLIVPGAMNTFKVLNEKQSQEARALEQKRKIKATRSRKHIPLTKVSYINQAIYVDEVNIDNLYTIFMSCVHVYKNAIYDLLDETNKSAENKELKEDSKGEMYVENILEIEVRTPSDAFELLSIASRLQRVYQATLGDHFESGHTIFNIRMAQMKKGRNDGSTLKFSHLSIVEFCGWNKDNIRCDNEERLKEVTSLQNSMRIVKNNHRSKEKTPIPDDDYVVTKILNSYFKTKRRTSMLVCVNPMTQNYEELVQCLEFADRHEHIRITTDVHYLKLPTPEPTIGENERIPQQSIMLQNRVNTPENPIEEESGSLVQNSFKNVTASNRCIRYLLAATDNRKSALRAMPSEPLEISFRQQLLNLRRQNILNRYELREARQTREEVLSKAPLDDEDAYNPLDDLQVYKKGLQKMLDENIVIDIHRQREELNYRIKDAERRIELIRISRKMDTFSDVQNRIQEALQTLKDNTEASNVFPLFAERSLLEDVRFSTEAIQSIQTLIYKVLSEEFVTLPKKSLSSKQLKLIVEGLFCIQPTLCKRKRITKKKSYTCSCCKTGRVFNQAASHASLHTSELK
ncbi:pav [Trypoxylus dichotomus]